MDRADWLSCYMGGTPKVTESQAQQVVQAGLDRQRLLSQKKKKKSLFLPAYSDKANFSNILFQAKVHGPVWTCLIRYWVGVGTVHMYCIVVLQQQCFCFRAHMRSGTVPGPLRIIASSWTDEFHERYGLGISFRNGKDSRSVLWLAWVRE